MKSGFSLVAHMRLSSKEQKFLQKNILPILTELFPNIQFIVSTHSPFILNSISNVVIYDLENKTLVNTEEGLSNIPYEGGDFMIPTGTRTTYSIGAQYHDKKQTLAVALGWMNVGSLDFRGEPPYDTFTKAHTRDSYTKMASISYQRNF